MRSRLYWIGAGAKFWMKVFNDLRTRGVLEILIAVTDGLSGMPQAMEVVFPKTTLQTCIPRSSRGTHLIRNSLDYASWKDRKPRAAALRPIYAAASAEASAAALDAFEAGGRVGTEVPDSGGRLAPRVGAGDPVLYVSAGDQTRDLHHQCD